eukprot:7391498-Prymnesium_polylepis.1
MDRRIREELVVVVEDAEDVRPEAHRLLTGEVLHQPGHPPPVIPAGRSKGAQPLRVPSAPLFVRNARAVLKPADAPDQLRGLVLEVELGVIDFLGVGDLVASSKHGRRVIVVFDQVREEKQYKRGQAARIRPSDWAFCTS